MEHPRIDDEKILDRYLAGELPADEEALFEEHLFECAECLEKAEWGEEMRRGLCAVAAEDATRTAVSLGLVAWLRSRPSRLAGFGVFAVAFLALLGALAWQQSELGRARLTAAGAPALVEPIGDLLVVSLGVVRDASSVAEIRLDPEKDAVLLSLELPAVTAARYRVTLRDGAGENLWRGEDLEPNLYETLLVALPSSFLEPGEYRITVEGQEAAAGEPEGEMALRVLPAP